ncbi:RNA-directed DNA polymerase [Senna tora]|uniref:RNA-directed DNA polymerase n=1 Tax=Senna tora TaxID=362788 RepID=A0A834T4E0_9FABA|nr:RNA-directed DNA polymerase [Senna tora]
MELANLTPKKSGGSPHQTSNNRKTKPPHEKASEHIVITSNLESIAPNMGEPWVVMGDFNSYLFAHEKQGGGAPNASCMDRFSRCISNCNLVDLGFKGPKFTWKRNNIMERIDRVSGNQVWVSNFSNYSVFTLPSFKSDHNAILLKPTVHSMSSSGEKPFRFQAAWLTHNSFEDLVVCHWNHDTH